MSDKLLSIGVSIFIRNGQQSLWENGIYQNCLFLVMLLRKIPSVKSVYLVAGGAGPNDVDPNFIQDADIKLIDMNSAMDELDVMIEMSAQLDVQWVQCFNSRGGLVVSMRCGNDYVIDIERMIFNKTSAHLVNGAHYHEVWILPEFDRTCRSYFEHTFRAPVINVPHLWSPIVLNRASDKQSFGYRPNKRRWKVGIFEPNVCMVKTSFIPMLICEALHRAEPDILEHVWAFNTSHLKEQPLFKCFIDSLDIKRHNLMSSEARYPFVQIVPMNVDAVVCHHWENAQNYLYYEALYGGYPLIHNSDMVGGCGYRYNDFDCIEGADVFLRAFREHDNNLDSYNSMSKKFLATLDPEAECNIRFYAHRINNLVNKHAVY